MCLDKKIRISSCLIVYTLYVVLKKRYLQWSKQCVSKHVAFLWKRGLFPQDFWMNRMIIRIAFIWNTIFAKDKISSTVSFDKNLTELKYLKGNHNLWIPASLITLFFNSRCCKQYMFYCTTVFRNWGNYLIRCNVRVQLLGELQTLNSLAKHEENNPV